MGVIYKTNAEYLREARKLDLAYQKNKKLNPKGKSMFSKKFNAMLDELLDSDDPDYIINAKLNKILEPTIEKE